MALKAIGQKVVEHVVIGQVAKDAPSAALLKAGDEIVDRRRQGRSTDSDAVRAAVGAHKPGETVALRPGPRRQADRRSRPRPATPTAAPRSASSSAIRFEFPIDVKINAGNVGGPSAGTMFSLASTTRSRPARSPAARRSPAPARSTPPARWARSAASAEARRRPRRRREVVPRSRRQLRRGRRPRPRRAAGGPDRDLRRGQEGGRGHRRQARRLAAHLHEVALGRGAACAAAGCRRAGSALQRRPERVHEARGDVLAEGDLVVAVVGALAQQAAALTVAGHGDEQPDVLAGRVGGQGVDRLTRCARAGRARPPAGTTMRSTARAAPTTLSGQAIPPSRLSRLEVGGRSSCSIALRAPSARSAPRIWARRCGSRSSRSAVGTSANSRGFWSQPGGGDVAFGVEGGDGQRVGDGLGGLAHAPIVPHRA